MSSSVVPPAQWSDPSPAGSATETTPANRPLTAVPAKLANGNGKTDQKSVSPVPSSTRSTRSRKNVTYSESDSPEELPKPLPPVKISRPATKTKKSPPKKSPPKKSPPKRSPPVKAKTLPNGNARVVAPSGRATRSSSKSISPRKDDIPLKPIAGEQSHLIPSPPSQAEDQDQSQEIKQTPEPVKADLPPSTSTLRISFTNAGVKRRAISQDPTEDLDGTTTNDNTPQVSPTMETDLQLANEAVEAGVVAAPKKAPRKKRKWLKRGEVDPDDHVAVAKQQERFVLLDRADALLEEQMQAVRDGTHPHLAPLYAELATRKDRLLKACDYRYHHVKLELSIMRDQAKASARNDHFDASCFILNDLCDEQRHKKYAVLDERNAAERAPDLYPSLKTGRGSGGWPVHPDHLWSNGLQPSTSYELDGVMRERKLIDRGPGPIPLSVAKADLELFTEYKRKRIVPPSPPGPKRRSHVAQPHKAQPLGRHVPGQQLASGAGRAQMPEPRQPSGAYEVKDLPPYKPGGSVPMRQTPTHSPSPTPARRASPLPGAQVHTPSNLASNAISSAGFPTMKYPHIPVFKPQQKSSQTLTTTASAGGVRPASTFGKYSTLPNGSASPFASVGQPRKP